MGSGASTINNNDIPDEMNLEEAKAWAKQTLDVSDEDWPEEKWLELSGEKGTISKSDIVKLCEDLALPTSSNDQNQKLDDDEEIFAADGEIEESTDDLAKGTFNEDIDDGLDLGGMMIPDLAVVGGNGPSSVNNNSECTSIPNVEGGGEVGILMRGATEEIIAVDGEAFESASGPGCFDDNSDGGGIAGNNMDGLEVTGSPVKSPEREKLPS
eukprot:CAMPEP_0114360950 /NCGR_PEP_ID=MMETSP0101-20121206/24281_1 /TAXON_ID=38822 ORGANISM="Pteridomonas danica, Strain PT" /NCGR_SAMPLE_ID=MMETSP0101 /ASSEMBLY_ACC=CAM_ASM_000211 /LENGTH=211 /DNA_ID=CAMNT_0001505509 /DNA_START=30 /DNA_END=665 /DNA_ORIENTATION=-